jgi:ComF family protein
MTTWTLPSLGSSLLDMALPAVCAGCGAEGTALCRSCCGSLDARLDLPAGVPMGLPAAMPLSLTQLEWCAPFSGATRRALHKLKYGGEQRLAVPLGHAMANRWRVAGVGGDLLVPVPVHAARERVRGYDQAVLLAAAISPRLGLPWRAALARTRHTAPQFELGRRARRDNVSGAFGLRGATPAARAGNRAALAGRWVILIDDVVTTGSTLVACADVLYGCGAVAVSALTAARER